MFSCSRYLNGYTRETAFHVPPGWDRWFGIGEHGGAAGVGSAGLSS